MDDLSDIRELYNNAWEVESDRLIRHQLEADLTWRYIDHYLPDGARVLEIGCGTGHYTFPLAQRGHRITAIDLSDEFVEKCRSKARDLDLATQIDFLIGDARTLDGIERGDYDAVLLMGPLYHLLHEEDRASALQACIECLKPGGVILSAMISRFGVLADLIKDRPEWIQNQEHVWSHIRSGHRPEHAPRGGFRGYFVRVDEIAPMHEQAGFETVKVAGVEPVIAADDESYNGLEGSQKALWFDLLFHVSSEESILAGSRHILYVGRRPN